MENDKQVIVMETAGGGSGKSVQIRHLKAT